jgi:hypothetical protein
VGRETQVPRWHDIPEQMGVLHSVAQTLALKQSVDIIDGDVTGVRMAEGWTQSY